MAGPAMRARAHIRRNPALNGMYRVLVAVLGAAVIAAGLLLVPLPGPGWVIVFAGLALWATEFEWAGRLVHWARGVLRRWTVWLGAQAAALKAAFGLAAALALVGLFWLVLAVSGVPGWVPDGLAHALDRVPGVAPAGS